MTAPALLERIISPAAAVDYLSSKGVQVSERTLKERAREIGAYRQIGRAIFFTPEDLEKIMEPTCSPLKDAPRVNSGTRGGRSTVSALSEARAKLQSLKRARS